MGLVNTLTDNALEVIQFEAQYEQKWNDFVAESKNGTFLFNRGYMDYHSDRFDDASLILRQDGKLLALFPANRADGELHSHGGLTYGGLITDARMSAGLMLSVFEALTAYGRDIGLSRIVYKAVPHMYHRQPAEEEIYALFRIGAAVTRVDAAAVICLSDPIRWSKGRKHGLSKARKRGLECRESEDLGEFYSILSECLAERHAAAPTHSLGELTLLKSRFPAQIKLWAAFDDQRMLGGLVTYDCGPTVHIQYMASTADGREFGALDLIVKHLAYDVFYDQAWLDFGISTERNGWYLNQGLARQKEMFGARTFVYNTFSVEL